MKKYSVGIDIGGTNTVIGIIDNKEMSIEKNSFKTHDFPNIDDYVDRLANDIKRLYPGENCQIENIGIGAPNANHFTGCIDNAPNLPWKDKIFLCDMLAERLNCPRKMFAIDNDANAAARGEKKYGKAKDLDNFIMITLGTGVGSGIFVDGKLVYGTSGAAGEIGHTIIDINGRKCGCGRCGCLETYCSANGVARTAREFLKNEHNSLLHRIESEKITSKDIADAANKGDLLALKIFEYTGNLLGFALANAVALTSPSHIFLLGGLAKSGELIFNPTRKAMDKYLLNIFCGTVVLEPSGIDNDNAAIFGAAAIDK